jgi:hypothetical protein
MRRYEAFQIDRTIETWFRTNMTMIVFSSALVVQLILAYVLLSSLVPGTVKNILYAVFFITISYTIVCIGLMAGGRGDIASKLGAKL